MSVQFQPTVQTNNKLKDLLHRGGREQIEREISLAVSTGFQALESAPISDKSLIISYRDRNNVKTDNPVTDTPLARFVKWMTGLFRPGNEHYVAPPGQKGTGAPANPVNVTG